MPGRLGSWLIAAATALVILGGSILPFLTHTYVRVEQGRSGVERLTGWDRSFVDDVTSSILADLLFFGDFDIADGDVPVLNDRERAHMRDVRGVLFGFLALAAAAAVAMLVVFRRARGTQARAAAWRAVASGARGLSIALAVVGAFALLAFDAAFEIFHRLFFSAGTYTFDPRTSRLVQLFPEQFWSDTAIAVGIVAMVIALATAWPASRRAGESRTAPALITTRVQT